jgi:DNA-binding MarR family transcriptional regulator
MMQQSEKRKTTAKMSEIHGAIEQLRVLADVFERRREALARGAGLTVEQWRVLEEIASEHFIPSMFARSRESSPAAVSKILRQVLDSGLVSVAIGSNDRRQRSYTLTHAGRRALERLRTSRFAAIDAIWKDLPAPELSAFRKFAEKLAARIEAYAKPARTSDARAIRSA